MLKIKRVYDTAEKEDGFRILVDRLWPRGVSKKTAKVDLWLKEIGPSKVLRKWFGHDISKWEEFRGNYLEELEDKKELLGQIKQQMEKGDVTLVFAARDEEHNNAVVLKELLRRF